MNNYWKSFKIEELFKRDNSHKIKESQKQLEMKSEKDVDFSIAITDAGGTNNGVAGWIDKQTISDITKVNSNRITLAIGGNASGCCFYHPYDFVSTRSNSMLIFLNDNIKNILSINSYRFFAKFLTLIFHNRFHGFMREMGSGNDFNREIILLPVRTCLENEKEIWTKDDGTKITLDVDKIQEIMEKVENHKKEKTIRKYEAEKAKYELEKAKYDEDDEFIEKYKKMYWKDYRTGDLIKLTSKHIIKESAKEILTSKEKTNDFCIGNTGMTYRNNGIVNFVKDEGSVVTKKIKNIFTVSPGGNGTAGCFFYQNDFIISTGNNSLVEFMDKNLENNITKNIFSAEFFALLLTNSFKNRFHSYARRINTSNDFNREIILLPVIQNDQGNEEIFTDAMAYLYLKSMILKQDKKIQNYNNKIKELKGE